MQPFLDSTAILDDGAELASRMQRDGYLFLRGLLPKDVLEDLRMTWLGTIAEAGWVDTDHPLEDGVADMNGFCVEPQPHYMDVYFRVYRQQQFHALQHHPNLIGLFERMWGTPGTPADPGSLRLVSVMLNLMANNRYAATRRRRAIAPKPAKVSRQTDVGSGTSAPTGPSVLPKFCCTMIRSPPVT